MNFGFTEEQELLRAEVRKFLDENVPMTEVRRIAEGPGFDPELHRRMAELGWLGLTIPERFGGAGLGAVDQVVLLEELGRSLAPTPLVSTSLFAALLEDAGSEAQQAAWLPEIAAGRRIGTLAFTDEEEWPDPRAIRTVGEPDGEGFRLSGEKLVVADAPTADAFAVAFRTPGSEGAEGVSLALVPAGAAGVTVDPHVGIDLTKRAGRLRLEGVRVGPADLLGAPGSAWPALERAFCRGAVVVTAEGVGAAEAALQLTVSYAKQRIQFGQPIGRFQGVKHPLAEYYVDIESVKSLVTYAAWCLDHAPEEAPLAASRAKAYASEAFPKLGIDTVGLHGAIGYTWEYDAHLFLKRMKWLRPAFGDAAFHHERVAALGGL